MKKVLLAANISGAFHHYLDEQGYETILYKGGDVPFDATGIITSTKLKLDKSLLSQFNDLKWIARLGSGIEIIDTAYCEANNIAFASSPMGIANAVGEHCIASLVALKKNISSSFSEIKNNQWIREPNRGWEVFGDTIGLIGYGHTARAFAKKLQGFDCEVIAYDKFKQGFSDELVKEVSLASLQKRANVISFHVPSNSDTHHYYDKEFIDASAPHILVNTSRGDIVCTKSLIDGLGTGHVFGAALDVLENEHLLSDSESEQWGVVQDLLKFNTLITPHIAGYSHDAIEKMSAELLQKLSDVI